MNFIDAEDVIMPADAITRVTIPSPPPGTRRYLYTLSSIFTGLGQPANAFTLNDKPLQRSAVSTTGTVATTNQTSNIWPLFLPITSTDRLEVISNRTGIGAGTFLWGIFSYHDQPATAGP